MNQSLSLIKQMGVTALLVSTLAISNPASALNTTIGQNAVSFFSASTNLGQSFLNDPAPLVGTGTGATINLNTWSFGFGSTSSQSTALLTTLTIYNGLGNGGTVVGTSTSTSTAAVTGVTFPVTWTFAGGLAITDTSTYTAVLAPNLVYGFAFGDNYPNGGLYSGTLLICCDTIFQATFSSATPVPFEFSPALGLVGLGALWLVKNELAKKTK